jgi:hypothetical protein
MAKETGLVTKKESRQINELGVEIIPQPEKRGESEKPNENVEESVEQETMAIERVVGKSLSSEELEVVKRAVKDSEH